MSTTVQLANGTEIRDAIARVRDDTNGDDWVLVGHQNGNPNVLELVATGNSGVDGLRERLATDQVQYALLRLTNKIDLSVTVKFVYIYNFAEGLSFVKKGRFGVVKGDATTYFQPYHVATEIGSPNELKEDAIREMIEDAAGNANHVRDADFVEGRQMRGYTSRMQTQNETLGVYSAPTTQNASLYAHQPSANGAKATSDVAKNLDKQTGVSGVNKFGKSVGVVATQSQVIPFDDSLTKAIADVHSGSETVWALGAYKGGDVKQPVTLVASGSGSADELRGHLAADAICYGIVRDTDYIDGHPTTKFAFFEFIGANVGFVKKGKVTTHKGAIRKAFEPFHVDFSISSPNEIDQDIVHSKIAYYSGSKSNVR